MGAESGRNTCDSPNWQQIPSHGETARYIKEIISVPNKDEYFLATLDYSSLQIRLVAIDSNDKALAGAYRKDANADLHSITGYSIFAEGKKFDIDEVVVNVDGKERIFLAKEDVSIIRNGKHTRVLAEHLKETDIIEA
jgi:DNA polymerase I-like protein with 3'-5' exonuclease and polymerase domains